MVVQRRQDWDDYNEPGPLHRSCACRKHRFGRIDDAARQPGRVIRCVRSAEPGARMAHLCPTSGAFSDRCNTGHRLERARFDAWLRAQSETATFFLDSIDELKISQGSFEQALKHLSRALAGHLGRARIVITTRPIPIDQQLIERHLPIPRATEAAATAEEFADVAMSRQRQHRNNAAEPKLWRNVALMPLSRDQIRDFAIVQGVTNPDELLVQRRRLDVERQPVQETSR
jgi:hypothetical protein